MNSNSVKNIKEAYIWIWLPSSVEPIVCGKLEKHKGKYYFVYGKSYLSNKNAISLSPVELELSETVYAPVGINNIHPCIRDSAPDAWGRRVIDYKYSNFNPNELDYLLLSNSNKIGALDFQTHSNEYVSRDASSASLEQLMAAAEIVDNSQELPAELNLALFNGTSIGGARPKALVLDSKHHKQFIAKFSSNTDQYNIIKSEYVAMKLAPLCGIDCAKVVLKKVQNKNVLLVERFDRKYSRDTQNYFRLHTISALSLLQLNEMEARYASYISLANLIRKYFYTPKEQLVELYKRLLFNVLVGNTDDHARNHAAFWDGQRLKLTPAYDICPQLRAGFEATQAMQIEGQANNFSTISNVVSVCEHFLIERQQAKDLANFMVDTINSNWQDICGSAELTKKESELLYGKSVLNAFVFQDF